MNLKKIKLPLIFLILMVGILLGAQIQKALAGDNLIESLKKFNDVLTFTERYYVEEIDTGELVEEAIKGMLNTLDPHSIYIPAKQLKHVEEEFRGNFEGIGIEFQIVNDTLTVVSPITGGPSEALGIMSGDRIVKISGKDAIGITADEVRNTLRGEAGTKVKVSIFRAGFDELLEFEITRDKIPLYSVDASIMIDDEIGFLSVTRFSETTFDEIQSELKDLEDKGMKKLILDLRNNPGGYLGQAVQVADLFISGDKKIVYTLGRRSEFNETYYAARPSAYEQVPLIVLINRGSASASEIVSGAVQDWDRGLVVGETSFGKGLVQRQFTLRDNSALRLTISKYYTPSGRSIQRDYKHTKSRGEYYSNSGNDDVEEGENLNHISEKDSSLPVYKTNKGRSVYGGGGITPDYIVKADSITKYTAALLRKNVFYLFILHYLDSHGNRIKTEYQENLDAFVKKFKVSGEIMEDFVEFAKDEDVEFVEEDYQTDMHYLKARLKAQIARNYWKNEGWYSVLIYEDNQVKKALTLFDEAIQLADLK